MRPQPGQHLSPGAGGQEGHDVAGRDDEVERVTDPPRRQVEFGEVADQPPRPGVVLLGGGDQGRVDVDADHPVAGGSEVAAHPARAAARVEDVRAAWCHRVHQAGLPRQILTGAGHRPEALDVPVRVVGISRDLLHPDACLGHPTIIPAAALPSPGPGSENGGDGPGAGNLSAVSADVGRGLVEMRGTPIDRQNR